MRTDGRGRVTSTLPRGAWCLACSLLEALEKDALIGYRASARDLVHVVWCTRLDLSSVSTRIIDRPQA